jgi:glycerophosphoryl diester phosphodiesterase
MSLDRPGSGRVLVVGHRGAEALAPENTWPAFRIGLEAGTDLLEVDVQLSHDGEAIVFHDFTLQAKLGDPRWVRDLDWAELQRLDVGSWFGPQFAGERIPRLADVLSWARERVALWVDLKHGFVGPSDDRLEMAALDLIEEAGMAGRVVISSWDQVALARIAARRPEIPLGVNLRERVLDPVAQVTPSGARWVALYWPQADRQTVVALQEAGLFVALANLFTGDYAEGRRLGVDAVMASDPRTARAALWSTTGSAASLCLDGTGHCLGRRQVCRTRFARGTAQAETVAESMTSQSAK